MTYQIAQFTDQTDIKRAYTHVYTRLPVNVYKHVEPTSGARKSVHHRRDETNRRIIAEIASGS